jgi:hypothetical protein
MERWRVPLQAEGRLDDEVWSVHALPDGALFNLCDRPEIVWVDGLLRERARIPLAWLHRGRYRGSVAGCAAPALVAVSGPDRLAVCTPDGAVGFELPHPVWPDLLYCCGAATWARGGALLWAVVPTTGQDPDDQILLIDTATRTLLGRASLRINDVCAYRLVAHPDGIVVGVDALPGHDDGSYVRWARWDGVRLTVTGFGPTSRFGPTGRVLSDIHPTGSEFITVPFAPPYDDNDLVRHAFPGPRPIGRIEGNKLFGMVSYDDPLDGFEGRAFYVDGGRIAARTIAGRVLLLAVDPLRPLCELDLEAYHTVPLPERGPGRTLPQAAAEFKGDLIELLVLGGGRLLTTHANRAVRLYDLSAAVPARDRNRPAR